MRAVALICLFAATANAAPDDDQQTEGEARARAGDYLGAIELFKQAEAARPTAERECLIALAYTRRNLYGQAQLFLDRCNAHGAVLPTWFTVLENSVREQLAMTFARVDITIEHGEHAVLSVSAFAPDETFGAGTIYLPRGHHVITARFGAIVRETTLDVSDQTRRYVAIDLATSPTEPHRGRTLVIAGAATSALGAIAELTWYRSERNYLADAKSPHEYDIHTFGFQASRATSIALYGVGAIAFGIGIALAEAHPETPQLAVVPVDRGGLVTIGWQR